MANFNDGIFTQPGPDGIFNRGGPALDASSAPIDADGTPLRETLHIMYPSPGHMRVARAIRHPQTGRIELQEEHRVPTPEEVALLRSQGVEVGAGSMVTSSSAMMPPTQLGPTPTGFGGFGGLGATTPPPAAPRFPWLLTGAAAVAGAAAFWAVNKYVVPMVWGDKPSSRSRKAADDDVDDLDLGLDDDDDEG